MKGKFPNKLFNITLTGRALKNISPDILRVRSAYSTILALEGFGCLIIVLISGYKESTLALRYVQYKREHGPEENVRQCRVGEERDRSPSP